MNDEDRGKKMCMNSQGNETEKRVEQMARKQCQLIFNVLYRMTQKALIETAWFLRRDRRNESIRGMLWNAFLFGNFSLIFFLFWSCRRRPLDEILA